MSLAALTKPLRKADQPEQLRSFPYAFNKEGCRNVKLQQWEILSQH